MANKIQFRRGLVGDIPSLDEGEPGWATDTEILYVGNPAGGGNIPIAGGGTGNVIKGTSSIGQVAYWSGANIISGDTNLLWNDTENRLHNDSGPLKFGANAASGHSLSIGDVLVGGQLEVDSEFWINGATAASQYLKIEHDDTDAVYTVGTGKHRFAGGIVQFDEDTIFDTSTVINFGAPSGATPLLQMPGVIGQQLVLGTDTNAGTAFILSHRDWIGRNHDHANQINPTFFVHSVTDPNLDNTQWLSLTHNAADAEIGTGLGGISFTMEGQNDILFDHSAGGTNNILSIIPDTTYNGVTHPTSLLVRSAHNASGGTYPATSNIAEFQRSDGQADIEIGELDGSANIHLKFPRAGSATSIHGDNNNRLILQTASGRQWRIEHQTYFGERHSGNTGAARIRSAQLTNNSDITEPVYSFWTGTSASTPDDDTGLSYGGADNIGLVAGGTVVLNATSSTLSFGVPLDLDGSTLVLDADGDTSIGAATDDEIDITIGGSTLFELKNVGGISTIASGATNIGLQPNTGGTGRVEFLDSGGTGRVEVKPNEPDRFIINGSLTYANLTGTNSGIYWSNSNDAWLAASENYLMMTTFANYQKDHGHATQTDPTLFIHAADDVDINDTLWMSFHHDGNAVTGGGRIAVGSGFIHLDNDTSVGLNKQFFFGGAGSGTAAFNAGSGIGQFTLGVGSAFDRAFILTSYGDRGKNHGHAVQTNPTLFIHSAADVDVDDTQWISFAHDQTDGVIDVGSGKHIFQTAGVSAFEVEDVGSSTWLRSGSNSGLVLAPASGNAITIVGSELTFNNTGWTVKYQGDISWRSATTSTDVLTFAVATDDVTWKTDTFDIQNTSAVSLFKIEDDADVRITTPDQVEWTVGSETSFIHIDTNTKKTFAIGGIDPSADTLVSTSTLLYVRAASGNSHQLIRATGGNSAEIRLASDTGNGYLGFLQNNTVKWEVGRFASDLNDFIIRDANNSVQSLKIATADGDVTWRTDLMEFRDTAGALQWEILSTGGSNILDAATGKDLLIRHGGNDFITYKDSTDIANITTVGGAVELRPNTTLALTVSDTAVVSEVEITDRYPFENNTDTSISPNALTNAESGKLINNTGVTAEGRQELPTAVAGLVFRFYNGDSDGIRIDVAGGDEIYDGSGTGTNISISTVGGYLELVAVDATRWVVSSVIGTWTLA